MRFTYLFYILYIYIFTYRIVYTLQDDGLSTPQEIMWKILQFCWKKFQRRNQVLLLRYEIQIQKQSISPYQPQTFFQRGCDFLQKTFKWDNWRIQEETDRKYSSSIGTKTF